MVGEASAHVEWLTVKHPELRPENLDHKLVNDDPFWVRLQRRALVEYRRGVPGPEHRSLRLTIAKTRRGQPVLDAP